MTIKVKEFLKFIDDSPTPFHATQNLAKILKNAGFTELDEKEDWSKKETEKSFVIRGGSSILAFYEGEDTEFSSGIRFLGAHTDSPTLKVKPNPEIWFKDYLTIGVEVYGGVLLSTWFDRSLSLAGRVFYELQDGSVQSKLIDFERPVASLPSLAIHLDRKANSERSIQSQKEIHPLFLISHEARKDESETFLNLLKLRLLEQYKEEAKTILDFNLSFYDVQPSMSLGYNDEFVQAARLDNLLSCYANVLAFIEAAKEKGGSSIFVAYDHEEVGSSSSIGAMSTFIKSFLTRVIDSEKKLEKILANSYFLSVDNAHGVHPNFPEKHDNNHGPIINKGPVIKINANQRYASNDETNSLYIRSCNAEQVPFQKFVMRNDMACGSTIGPLSATNLGVKTVDVGVSTFAMHSIREMGGVKDLEYLFRANKRFLTAR